MNYIIYIIYMNYIISTISMNYIYWVYVYTCVQNEKKSYLQLYNNISLLWK